MSFPSSVAFPTVSVHGAVVSETKKSERTSPRTGLDERRLGADDGELLSSRIVEDVGELVVR